MTLCTVIRDGAECLEINSLDSLNDENQASEATDRSPDTIFPVEIILRATRFRIVRRQGRERSLQRRRRKVGRPDPVLHVMGVDDLQLGVRENRGRAVDRRARDRTCVRIGSCGTYPERTGQTGVLHELFHDELGDRTAADVGVADEQYGMHVTGIVTS